MMSRHRKIYRSNCREYAMSGTKEELVSKYEGLAYQLQRENKISEAHELFQQAEHFKRIEEYEV